MSKPNWSEDGTLHGGHVKDVPLPHVRKFPHRGALRVVSVHITSFVGVCAGARHYSPTIEEEGNPLWNSAEERWQKSWDDLEGNGVVIHGPRFTSEKKAREWVQWMLRGFDPKKYRFEYAMHAKAPKWFYAREGD